MRNVQQIALVLNKGILPQFHTVIIIPYIKPIVLLTVLGKLSLSG